MSGLWTSDSIEWEIEKYQKQIETTINYYNRWPTPKRANHVKTEHFPKMLEPQQAIVTTIVAQLLKDNGNFDQSQIQEWAMAINDLNAKLNKFEEFIDRLVC